MKQALILAAGMGSRLSSAQEVPKPLTPIGGEVSIFRLIRQFTEAGITDVAVTVGFRGDEIKDYFKTNYSGPAKIHWFENNEWKKPNGLSLLAAADFITERTMLSMADHLFIGSPVPQMAALPVDSPESVLLVDRNIDSIFDMDDATKVLTDENGNILDIGKMIPAYNAVDTGLFVISPALIKALSGLEAPSLSEGVKMLASEGLMQTLDLSDGTWQDIDTPQALEYAKKLLSDKENR